MDTVSVVIPSWRSSRTVRFCLRSVLDQQRPADEVVVVDSSDDGTPDLIEQEFPEVRVVRREKRTLYGGARNIGVQNARHETLAFIDSDCVAKPDWLSQHLAAHEAHPEASAVVGSVGAPPAENEFAKVDRLLEFGHVIPRLPAQWGTLGSTSNMTVRKDRFKAVGGFAEDLLGNEDYIFCRGLAEHFGQLWFEPSAEVGHMSRDTRASLLEHQRRLGRGFVQGRRHEPGLPGGLAVRHRWLMPLLLPARLWLLLSRYARWDRAALRYLTIEQRSLATAGIRAWWDGMQAGMEEVNADA